MLGRSRPAPTITLRVVPRLQKGRRLSNPGNVSSSAGEGPREARWRGRPQGLIAAFILLLHLGLASSAHAVEPDEVLSNPVLEARARTISEGLRCLVCQNQSIDDSAAPLARDLRLIVREHLQAGDTDDAIRAYLVQRYGDFVLLKPPLERSTLILWGTPALIVVFGGFALLRRRRTVDAPAPLTADEQARLDALMADARR